MYLGMRPNADEAPTRSAPILPLIENFKCKKRKTGFSEALEEGCFMTRCFLFHPRKGVSNLVSCFMLTFWLWLNAPHEKKTGKLLV